MIHESCEKTVIHFIWAQTSEEKRLNERIGRPVETGLDESVNQDAKRCRGVIEALVKAQEVEEPQSQPGIAQILDQNLLNVAWLQRSGYGDTVESRFPALASSHDGV